MPLSSTSSVQVSYLKESVFGVTPATGTPQALRVTGESLDFSITKASSNEINSSRTVSSMVPTGAEAAGGVNFEFSYDEYDDLMASTLQSTWAAMGAKGDTTTFSATITATTISAAVAPTATSALTLLAKGQWFTLGGTGTANDGKLFRVSKVTAPTATVITLDAGTPAVVGGPFAATVLRSSRLTHGVSQTSFTLQRSVTDANEFFSFTGMTPSAMNLSIAAGSISTGDFSFMGKAGLQGNVDLMPGAAVASSAFQIMSGNTGAATTFWAGGVPMTGTFANSVKMSFDNALRTQKAIGPLASVGVGSGTINPKLDVEIYFSSGAAFYSKVLDNTNTEIVFTSYDAEGNGYVFTFPTCNVSSYKVAAGGKDSDLMVQISFTPLQDISNATAALRKLVFIDRLGVAMP